MADAVVNVLLDKLLNTLEEKSRVVAEFRKEFEYLKKELQYMQCFLKDADRQKRKKATLRQVIADLRELIYEAEDILADCQLQSNRLGDDDDDDDDLGSADEEFSNGWLSCINPLRIQFQHQSAKRLKEINEIITSIKNNIVSYLGVSNNFERSNTFDRSDDQWVSSVYDHTQVVGLEDDKRKIKTWVFGARGNDLLTIAFVGMGGLGKTTIAQEVFNDKQIDDWFERKIWVSVSQMFTEEQIMRSILRNLGDASVGDDKGELLRKIRHYLLGKRYLIVMDDVWNNNLSWLDKILQGLPKGNGSGIIITTRFEEVARKTKAKETHRPKLLSDENSWLLFCKVAFAASSGNCDDSELEKIGMEIVNKCKGLPLAIKAVGGIMLCKEPIYHEWKRIADNFQDELASAENVSDSINVMASLQLSYDELPAYLKYCFLSFSLYPEDCVIPKEQLVHWWIGEGFVPMRRGRSKVDAGEDCFLGLTNRCLIEVVDKTYNGTISTCKIHDMVRDLVMKIAEDDAFFRLKGVNSRHLGITGNMDERRLKSNKKLRGIVSTTKTGELNKIESGIAKKFAESRYLRVLDVSKSIFESPLAGILERIDCLQHLTYLNLSNTHPLIQLPSSLERLGNLRIFDVSYCQNLKCLPPCIVSFKKLCVLDVTHCGSLDHLPKGLGNLSNLEVLLGFKPSRSSNGCRMSELRNLTRLRTLGLHLTRGEEIGEDEVDSLVNLEQVQFMSVSCFDSYGNDIVAKLDKLFPPRQLQELCLKFYPGSTSPVWLSPGSLPLLRYLSICSGNMAKMHENFWGGSDTVAWRRVECLMVNSVSDLAIDWEMLRLVMPGLRLVNASWCPELDSFPIQDVGFRGGVWTNKQNTN